jgi:hypothetical protein
MILTKQETLHSDGSTIPPISTKQERLNSDGQQFHQYQQSKKD